jgi:glycosyltransferase involved in cell wall biosynthesis
MRPDTNGGTEILYKELKRRIGDEYFDKINVIPSLCFADKIDESKINVLWQHENWDQDNVKNLSKHSFYSKIDHFVYISSWQYINYCQNFPINHSKCSIIRNCINPIEFIAGKNNKPVIIYTSGPWRGLDVLLEAFRMINRNDVELHIYSSTKIYGQEHYELFDSYFKKLYDYADKLPNVKRYEYIPNEELRQKVARADIFAYPSTYIETSCLAAIEALSSGCKVIVTNFGALPETCSVWATYVPMTDNKKLLVRLFADKLNDEINNYTERNKEQSDFYNKYYSWDFIEKQWRKLFNKLIENKGV